MTDRAPSTLSDDDLLQLLADAWAPARLEPAPASIAEVRLAFSLGTTPRTEPGTELGASWRRRRTLARSLAGRGWRTRLAVAGATIGVVVVGAGTAFAAGAPVPAPLRQLAYAIGLPVTPPAVVQVQSDAQTVRADLAPGSGASTGATARDAGALARALRQLSPAERASETWSEAVLSRACGVLSAEQGRGSASTPTTAGASEACQPVGSPPPGSNRQMGGSQSGNGPGGTPGGSGSSHGPEPGAGAPGGSGNPPATGNRPGQSGSRTANPQGNPGSGSQPGSRNGAGHPSTDGGSGPSRTPPGTGQANGVDMPSGSVGGSAGNGSGQSSGEGAGRA